MASNDNNSLGLTRRLLLATGVVAIVFGLFNRVREWFPFADDDDPRLETAVESTTEQVGSYQIRWNDGSNGASTLEIQDLDQSTDNSWSTPPDEPFIAVSDVDLDMMESRGSYTIEERVRETYDLQSVESIRRQSDTLLITGQLSNGNDSVPYELRLDETAEGHLRMRVTSELTSTGRLELRGVSNPEERFYGFGEQFSHLDMNGKAVAILTQEQGIGRGKPIVSEVAELFSDGSAGDAFTTYAPMPYYMTNTDYACFLENTEYSVFDMSEPRTVAVRVYADQLTARLTFGSEPLDLLESYTAYTGRMSPLPDWFHDGPIVGMQGGTEKVRTVFEELQSRDTPLGGFWLQDWVGQRTTLAGDQLWWNWELDRSHYPNWEELVETLQREDVYLLGYINPYLSDVSGKANVERDLYEEARRNGYFVETEDGNPYEITITTFDGAILDLSNEDTRQWLKSIIQEELLENGFRGWMADFGEGLPLDGVLDAANPHEFHNRYPVEWARVNEDAVTEVGADQSVFFTRAGYTRSPAHSRLFWEGDQLVTWDEHDGFRTAILGLLTGGLSGISLNHSDAGGYTTMSKFGVGIDRSEELLKRWVEANAFTAVLRTHEGNQPASNAQIYDTDELLDHFSRFANVYAAFKNYREELMQEAAERGVPVVRHPLLHYPDDPRAHRMTDQFMLGSEFMIAPIVEEGERSRRVYLPEGEWIHLWTGDSFTGETDQTVSAPIGEPPVFHLAGSEVASTVRSELASRAVLE
ncbi:MULTISPECIES: alpha-glucosidase [Haloferax]|uniref:Alpha-glucosidase n=1 Tax=Haloferax marinum TaxID=2666143 RepID=A0A6A8GAD7_9EURY|nr:MULTISPECIES: alpha-glucosidase [Haloferax]KAB1190650.1 alpha-glucosidase [Haloferax sp. CBA1150]MRW98179.1 alpha-glucosidase [Haloferax marinum]